MLPEKVGKYKIIGRISAGGMGVVYKAVQPVIERLVAVKVIKEQFSADPAYLSRFEQEIRAIGALGHPNIITLHDAGREGRCLFLVTEYVVGSDLAYLLKHEEFSLPEACEYVRQAALGIQHAFERNVVHRDIKPSNLMVSRVAERQHLVKILDFGIARVLNEDMDVTRLTTKGVTLGTFDYLAPEQIDSADTADIRADIFSLGCVLFELLSGRFPFPGENDLQRLIARQDKDAFRLRAVGAHVPPALEAVLAKMLARAPNARYQTPDEVARELEPFTKLPGATFHSFEPRPPQPASPVAAPGQ